MVIMELPNGIPKLILFTRLRSPTTHYTASHHLSDVPTLRNGTSFSRVGSSPGPILMMMLEEDLISTPMFRSVKISTVSCIWDRRYIFTAQQSHYNPRLNGPGFYGSRATALRLSRKDPGSVRNAPRVGKSSIDLCWPLSVQGSTVLDVLVENCQLTTGTPYNKLSSLFTPQVVCGTALMRRQAYSR